MANYHQKPVNIKGRLYSGFKTYDSLPVDSQGNRVADRIFCRIDTADEGEDFLCAICGIEYRSLFYVTDVYYTQDPQEVTENETVEFLIRNGVKEAIIESNNGGRSFARNVERILRDVKRYHLCSVTWFSQSQNKQTRILTNAPNVMNMVLFPNDWKVRWPKFHDDIMSYLREGRNRHDDAPDTLTGIAEELAASMIDTGAIAVSVMDDEYKF